MCGRTALTAMVLVSAILMTGAAGCIAVGGSDHYTKPTVGRQLMDLKTSRETGAISAQEYEQAKSKLLSS